MSIRISDWRGARWIEPCVDPQLVQTLSRECGVHLPVARVLAHRGLHDAQDIRRFLRPQWEHLHDPLLMHGMQQAADRIQHALDHREPILVYGDYDVDGTMSIVMLVKTLEALGAQVSHHVPNRLRDGYGMRPEVIEAAASAGIKLVISVDTGIRAHEVALKAQACGVGLIITDHHLPDTSLPAAHAVLNPNAPDCRYPEKDLCGAGVTFKLVQALLQRSAWNSMKQRRYLESLMKVTALATIADVVPLQGENRALVGMGLAGFDEVRSVGLRALLKVAGLNAGQRPSAGQVGFRIAPRINAAGRMDDANAVIQLFLTSDEAEAAQLAEFLDLQNQQRQAAEKQILDQVIKRCEEEQLAPPRASLVFAQEGWHRGVVGIVASRVVERYHRPTFIIGIENGLAQGSGRSIRAFDLHAALTSLSDLFVKFGGHKYAAGLTLERARLPEFEERLETYARSVLSSEDLLPSQTIDADLHLSELQDHAVDEIFAMEPFGHSNPAPSFLLRNVEVTGSTVFSEKHVRLNLRQNGRGITAKAWQMAPCAAKFPAGSVVDAIVCVEHDDYSRERGYGYWSVTVRDLRLV